MSEREDGAPPRRSRLPCAGLVLGLIALGTGLRLVDLGEGALFIDEGESCLNALSILEHGYPADRYLGLPMFENTLTVPWAESEEYEFRDSSYSRRGMAVYHGWLPLYAIAASLALHGIRPDTLEDPHGQRALTVRHSDSEIRERIFAARLPSVVFGALFLLAIFQAGRALYGVDAGLYALLAAALAPKCIWLAQQARYYSASLAFSTLALFWIWRASRAGRWRDYLLAAGCCVLLFHTSSLALARTLLAGAVLVPGLIRQPRLGRKLGVSVLVGLAGICPWLLWTGYLEETSDLPMARSLLEFPDDYLLLVRQRPEFFLAGILALGAFWAAYARRRRLSERLFRACVPAAGPLLFLAWAFVVSYAGFLLFVPAASCSMARLSHNLLPPAILMCAVVLAAGARAIAPARPGVLAPVACLALLPMTHPFRRQERNPAETAAVGELVGYLRERRFASGTRLYALPYQHFCLIYYTGLPIQSIAPVRREFLETYPGEVVILETVNRLPIPDPETVRAAAAGAGCELSPDEVRSWTERLWSWMTRETLAPAVRSLEPPLEALPAWARSALADLRLEERRSGRGKHDFAQDNPALFRGFPPLRLAEFWPVFFYRFLDLPRRSGDELNYAGRIRDARAVVLRSTWTVFHCPAREPGA